MVIFWNCCLDYCVIIVFFFVIDKFVVLWLFLGIVVEVIVFCVIIFIYEKKRSREMEDEVDGGDEVV